MSLPALIGWAFIGAGLFLFTVIARRWGPMDSMQGISLCIMGVGMWFLTYRRRAIYILSGRYERQIGQMLSSRRRKATFGIMLAVTFIAGSLAFNYFDPNEESRRDRIAFYLAASGIILALLYAGEIRNLFRKLWRDDGDTRDEEDKELP